MMVKFTKSGTPLLIIWSLTLIFLSSFFLLIDSAFSLDHLIKDSIPNYSLMNKANTNIIYSDFGVQFQLRIGEVASINSGEVELTFMGVTEDLRCPSDLNCFESGQIQVLVRILVDGQDFENLNLIYNASRKDISVKQFNKYIIGFIKAEPYPKSNQKIELTDYVITLEVTPDPKGKYPRISSYPSFSN